MFDYLIVGAGSAGCVLAERLSAQSGTRVCLLEAGPPDTHPLIHMPFGIAWLMWSKRLNWQYYTAPQRNLDGRRLFWPRGKTLGGSSSTNAMCYTRGHPGDYDDWVRMGNPGWGYADLLPYFRRSENRERGETAYHGVNGPLNVASLRSPNPLSLAFVEAGVQAGYPRNDDFNGASQEGVGLYEVTQKDGRRWSAAQAYLRPAMDRPNLTVIAGARATRVLFSGKRAVGVAYARGGGEERVEAGEVILAGGAINSPHLLLLSGVGPREELQPHGIDLRHELPGVGRNLQDHLDVLVVSKCRKPVSYGLSLRSFLRSGGSCWTISGVAGACSPATRQRAAASSEVPGRRRARTCNFISRPCDWTSTAATSPLSSVTATRCMPAICDPTAAGASAWPAPIRWPIR